MTSFHFLHLELLLYSATWWLLLYLKKREEGKSSGEEKDFKEERVEDVSLGHICSHGP